MRRRSTCRNKNSICTCNCIGIGIGIGEGHGNAQYRVELRVMTLGSFFRRKFGGYVQIGKCVGNNVG
jgi:hypothetical protein